MIAKSGNSSSEHNHILGAISLTKCIELKSLVKPKSLARAKCCLGALNNVGPPGVNWLARCYFGC